METSRSTQRDRVFRFGPFELSECDAELRKGGVRIKLQDQPFRVLVELVANAGKVVSREELQQKLWSADTFVDFDVGLNNAIRKLRQALNDDADHPHYIETLAKRGYRFVAQVAELGGVPQPKTQSAQVGPDRLDHSQDRIATESGGGTVSTKTLRERAMPWLLTVTVLAIAALGSYLWWRGKHSAPPLATEQRVTANPPEAPISAAAVSPDGKFVAYSDPTGVYIRHIDTGETRPLQLPKGFDAVPTSWFPDGTHLLLNSGGAQGNPSLWKVSILGGTPQELIDNASRGAVSPDGSKIAFTRGDAEASGELWVIGSDGSNPHSVVDAALPEASVSPGKGTTKQPYTGVLLSGVAWSPDGGRVAYLRRFEAVSIGPLTMKHSLETVDANGGIPKVLKISNQLLPVVGWAADGRLLYAYRDDPASEREDSAIWTLRVNQKSGEPEGKPLQLTKGVGRIGGLSVTADGRRLILWRVNSFPQVFLTEIDAETRRFKTPRRLTLDESTNIASSWTPDSRAVFFSSNRSGALQHLSAGHRSGRAGGAGGGSRYRPTAPESRRHAGPVRERIQPTRSLGRTKCNAGSTAGWLPAGGLALAVHRQHPMRTESVETLPPRYSGGVDSAVFYVRPGGR